MKTEKAYSASDSMPLLGRFLIDGVEISGLELCRLFGFAENKGMVTAALLSIEFQNGTVEVIET